ncbi:hypothetical protein [Leucobacter salsicius]|uniref:hypothetical protein n=1 Tax=Leucobacter salsicius TaxID=664638 RepID=UPI0003663537|nr:hypothetical protein [Leucobacter salsicius]
MSVPNVELADGEEIMDVADELMYRQITGLMMDNGKPVTAAFGPASIDKGKPSYSRSNEVSAQQARDWHTEYASRPSLGVWAVSVEEVVGAGLVAVDDSKTRLPPNGKRAPGHCFADFRGMNKREERVYRAKLYFGAIDRGEIPTTATLRDGQLFE